MKKKAPSLREFFHRFTVMIQEAMAKFAPQNDAPNPWIQILEYGHHVFHKSRLPCDLRVKWRNLMMKEPAGY